MYELTGKVAVVTGASSGLGKSCAMAYAKAGAQVVLLARRQEKLNQAVQEITAAGGKACSYVCDIMDEVRIKEVIETVINTFQHIDILLNNAGIATRGGVDTLTQQDWDQTMDSNVKGAFLMSKYVIPHMKEKKYGKVVNVASVNALIADKDDLFIRHAYNASKAAVLGLTKGMAASYARYNITVNAVCPGLFETEMTHDTLFASDAFLGMYNHQCPSDRPGAPGEMDGPILFFSSDASSYVNGQYIVVDGGISIV